jgi:hypothetical protein
MRKAMARCLLALAVVLAWFPQSVVAAPEQAPPAAESATVGAAKKAEGKRLYNQNKYKEALAAFEDAFRLSPDAGTALNIADLNRYFGQQGDAPPGSPPQARLMAAYNWADVALGLPTTAHEVSKAEGLRLLLFPHVAIIDVVTQPSGASVTIDGTAFGVRRSLAISPGPHHLLLTVRGHRGRELDVTTQIGAPTPVRFEFERLLVDVRIETVPPGAQLTVANQPQPMPPTPTTVRLPVGPAKISAALKGYVAQTHELEIPEAGLPPLVLTLVEDPSTMAALTVNGAPPGAAVTLDGLAAGTIPLSLRTRRPPSGRTEVQVSSNGFAPWRGLVTLEAGSVTRIDVALVPPAPPPSPIWKWLGYGGGGLLFGVGAAVGGVALTQNSSFYEDPTRAKYDRVNHLNVTADVLMGAGLTALVATGLFQLLAAEPPRSRAAVNLDIDHGR